MSKYSFQDTAVSQISKCTNSSTDNSTKQKVPFTCIKKKIFGKIVTG